MRHVVGDRFRVAIRGHEIEVDQPLDGGGTDEAPTPTELFVASLAACAAFFAGRFLRRHLGTEARWSVECRYTWSADRCTVVGSIRAGLDIRVTAVTPSAALA